jgi:hypothetical protein
MSERTCNHCNKELTSRQTRFCSHSCANKRNQRDRFAELGASPQKLCDVDGCGKEARSRTAALCKMHYHRVYRYGALNPVHAPKFTDLTGRKIGTLTMVKRVGQSWECLCDCGQARSASIGELNRTGEKNTCGVKANHLAEVVGYTGAHDRVRRLRGSASAHPCVDCHNTAYHWSYNHSDPDEIVDPTLGASGVAYSLSTGAYVPRCVPCHKRFDLAHINGTFS